MFPPLSLSGGSSGPSYEAMATGPVVVNVAGFGSKASGSATAPTVSNFPSASGALDGAVGLTASAPPWLWPVLAVVGGVLLFKRLKG